MKLLNEITTGNDWAIFRINSGKKWFATRMGIRNTPDEYKSIKYSSSDVLKFNHNIAIKIIQKSIGMQETYGIVNSKGVQKVFDWRVKYPNKYDDVAKLINETLTEGITLSEGMKYHINHNIPISENIYRWGSIQFFKLFNETRKLYKTGMLTELNQMDKWFLDTDLGKIGIYEGRKVLLDFPMIIKEAEYKGRDVELNKPSRSSGPKKYQVYVKNDKGNVIKVNFGDAKGGLTAKINDPEARKAFADRHDCKSKTDKTKAGYWSCNIPRYAKALGLSKGGNYYW